MPKIPFWVFLFVAAIHFTAVRVDIMDIDASQYAEISREMMESGSYLQIFDRGRDYLDKPPFLFWVSAISMKIFGANNFGYRLPSILFALWSLFATYRLGRLLYNEQTARAAALVLGCCQGMFLMTNDVRTDTILMSWTITAIWMIREWEVKRRLGWLLGGCASIAFGMMTKGPVALIVPVLAFSADWIFKRRWKNFFQWEYFAGIALIALLLVPMSIGLYQQYDSHPEKVIDGKTGVSGLRFFYWVQSFGRITGENTWDNNAPFGFLYENMLWAFLPWILLFTVALVVSIFRLFRQRLMLKDGQEWLTTGGFILAYIALGSSRYQLPHYIFVVFPLASIMVASLSGEILEGSLKRWLKTADIIQSIISLLLLVAAVLTFTYVFEGRTWTYIVMGIAALIWLWFVFSKRITARFLLISAAAMMAANIVLTNHFYYTLLKEYQTGSTLGRYIRAQNLPANKISIYQLDDPANSLHFYAGRIVKKIDSFHQLTLIPGNYIATGPAGLAQIQQVYPQYQLLCKGKLFKGSELTPTFINPRTRHTAVKDYYLIQL